MKIKIHNPNNLPTIDYRKVIPLQGDLKELSDERAKKLKFVLQRRGFRQPLNLWKNGDQFYIMDAHQRQRVMKKYDMNDDGSYDVPYIVTEAENIKEAKEQLLEITAQYGKITYEGFDKFIAEAEIPEAEVVQAVSFDALFYLGQDRPEEEQQPEKTGESKPTINIMFKDSGYLESAMADLIEFDFVDKYDAEIKVRGDK